MVRKKKCSGKNEKAEAKLRKETCRKKEGATDKKKYKVLRG
jgi:hypothetical protein